MKFNIALQDYEHIQKELIIQTIAATQETTSQAPLSVVNCCFPYGTKFITRKSDRYWRVHVKKKANNQIYLKKYDLYFHCYSKYAVIFCKIYTSDVFCWQYHCWIFKNTTFYIKVITSPTHNPKTFKSIIMFLPPNFPSHTSSSAWNSRSPAIFASVGQYISSSFPSLSRHELLRV
jgi:hypothetical protein